MEKTRLPHKLRYEILRACGYDHRAALHLIGGCSKDAFGDNLLMEQAAEALKRQQQEEASHEQGN